MTIIQMFCSPIAVVLTIATCISAAPLQIQGENIGLNNAVYSQPELAEALARTYEAIEWQISHERESNAGHHASRNLDHIGGGNLLRNLDHIGGGNLLRNLDHIGGSNLLRNVEIEDLGTQSNEFPNLSSSDEWAGETLDTLGGANLLRHKTAEINELPSNLEYINDDLSGEQRLPKSSYSDSQEFARNLDHIGGSNLLRDLRVQQNRQTRSPGNSQSRNNRPNNGGQQSTTRRPRPPQDSRGTLDSIGGGNIVRRSTNEFDRNLDHLGGSNLLRNLENGHSDNDVGLRSRWLYPESKEYVDSNAVGNQNEHRRPYVPARGNLDRIGGGNLLRLSQLAKRSSPPLDPLGGVPVPPRNLDPISVGHRMRQTRRGLDSLSGATFGESKRFEQHGIQSIPYKNINREAMMNRVQSEGSAKRNFDEIDRTNFDSFVKRNFDEIDRSGFDNFVKRNLMDAYLASRQR